jgi:hypothetical protein
VSLSPAALLDEAICNPIDDLEAVLSAQSWGFERIDDDALLTEINARWQRYPVQFLWRQDCETLVFACNYSFQINARQRAALFRLLVRINDGLMSGCFNYAAKENMVSYRNSLLVSGQESVNREQLQDLIEIGIDECERYFLAFDLLLNRQQTPEQAYQAAVFETVGEA